MDMQRTYLGHDFFQEQVARDVLYKISKAYSIYDEEVGYCQGLSFIIAVLLLQVSGGMGVWLLCLVELSRERIFITNTFIFQYAHVENLGV